MKYTVCEILKNVRVFSKVFYEWKKKITSKMVCINNKACKNSIIKYVKYRTIFGLKELTTIQT